MANEIVDMYVNGKSVSTIAKIMEVSVLQVLLILEQAELV